MTKDLTRQLAIEFERRLKLMYPKDTLNIGLTSDTIYSIFSEYQVKLIKNLAIAEDLIESGTVLNARFNDVVKPFIKTTKIPIEDRGSFDNNWKTEIKLPDDYFMYIRSTSLIDKSYKNAAYKEGEYVFTPNILIKETAVPKLINAHYNQGGIIRNPMIVLEDDLINVYHDKYTHIDAIDLTYYRYPKAFNILSSISESDNIEDTIDHCELPFEYFDDLVDGALKLFVSTMLSTQPTEKSKSKKEKEETE